MISCIFIVFNKKFNYNGGETVLDLKGRFSLADITLNGKAVKKSYFAETVDLKDYLIDGENDISITIYTDNRNLLGPFHYAEREKPWFVGPGIFELIGSWKDGESSLQRKNYALVRFGLFDK